MKLRNKKTGEIIEGLISAYGVSGDVAVSVMDCNAESGYNDLGRYKTLAELNEEWEDYKSAELCMEVRVMNDIEKAGQNMGLVLSPCQCKKLEEGQELWWRVRLENHKYLIVRARIYEEEK